MLGIKKLHKQPQPEAALVCIMLVSSLNSKFGAVCMFLIRVVDLIVKAVSTQRSHLEIFVKLKDLISYHSSISKPLRTNSPSGNVLCFLSF